MPILILVDVFTPYFKFKQILFLRVIMLWLKYKFTSVPPA